MEEDTGSLPVHRMAVARYRDAAVELRSALREHSPGSPGWLDALERARVERLTLAAMRAARDPARHDEDAGRVSPYRRPGSCARRTDGAEGFCVRRPPTARA